MTDPMIARCGLDCRSCPAHQAWKNDDHQLRAQTASDWQQRFGFPFTPEMINCSGCRVPGDPKIGHCSQCEMRSCATAKGHETCAACADFDGCKTIQDFIKMSPPAGETLVKLRA